ncbi:MAG: tetratricopeptide repeat protein, partial [Bacteroidia bacterium]|nr:tetratricopeptide repeat protein [Bacteroidia bacterium]
MYKKNIVLYLLFFFYFFWNSFAQVKTDKSNTIIADSLDKKGKYKESLIYRKLALNESKHSENYLKYINAKWHYTNACIYESIGGRENHKKAIEHSLKAKQLCETITSPISNFKYSIINRIYHQYGYTEDWKNTLMYAQEGLNILNDTLPENNIKVIDIIYDLGYIYNRLGDYTSAISQYEKSLQLYLKNFPEKDNDIAINYMQMAKNYRSLGKRNDEFRVLEKAENLFIKQIKKNYSGLTSTYEFISLWYSYYGNYQLAENYLNKQRQTINSITYKLSEKADNNRNTKLKLYNNYIELYLRTRQFENAKKYIDISNSLLDSAKNIFVFDIKFKAYNYFHLAKLPANQKTNRTIELLKKAINLIETHRDKYFIDSKDFKMALFIKYKEAKSYDLAERLLQEIIKSTSKPNKHELFILYTNYADLQLLKKQPQIAETFFKKGINIYSNKSKSDNIFNEITIDYLKPFYSYESINGIVLTANFCFNKFKNDKDINYLNASNNLY